jgi:hypothetical protein
MIRLAGGSVNTLLSDIFSHSFTDGTFNSNTFTINHNFGKKVGSCQLLVENLNSDFAVESGPSCGYFDYYDNPGFARGYVWSTTTTQLRLRVFALVGPTSPCNIRAFLIA